MKARTKIEKQVAASNEKLTAISPKVITWAVRKVAEHFCFRTSAYNVHVAIVADTSTMREKASRYAALIAVLAYR